MIYPLQVLTLRLILRVFRKYKMSLWLKVAYGTRVSERFLGDISLDCINQEARGTNAANLATAGKGFQKELISALRFPCRGGRPLSWLGSSEASLCAAVGEQKILVATRTRLEIYVVRWGVNLSDMERSVVG
jgi:hypothetical protein